MLRYFIYIILGAGLLACSSVSVIQVEADYIPVDEVSHSARIDSIVSPYRDSLENEMNVVIGHASENFEKGRPNGSLNNWAADAVYQHEVKTMDQNRPIFSLLNVGGLRNPISKGDVTVGDIFRLMPFDNEVVWVELPIESLEEVSAYLMKSGGEPIGGTRFEDGKILLNGVNDQTGSFWIITSDYLMNGGDNMSFFEKKISYRYANVLLRDLFIAVVKSQGEMIYNDEERIKL